MRFNIPVAKTKISSYDYSASNGLLGWTPRTENFIYHMSKCICIYSMHICYMIANVTSEPNVYYVTIQNGIEHLCSLAGISESKRLKKRTLLAENRKCKA